MENPALVLPDDFDEYAWEIEKKGWFDQARVRFNGQTFRLSFYDLARFSQDVEDELCKNPVFVEPNVVVLKSITRNAMERAVEFIAKADGFRKLKSEQRAKIKRQIKGVGVN